MVRTQFRDLKVKRERLSRAFRRLVPILAFVLLIVLFFNRLIIGNLILARGDTFLYFYPYWQAAAEWLTIERIPLWNPNLFTGAPFLANSQAGLMYPLNWPLWQFLDTPYAVTAAIIIHLAIAATGAYLAGRRCLLLDKNSSFVTALLFSLGGYLTAQVEHINQLQGLAWLPWFFAIYGGNRPERASVGNTARISAYSGLLFSLQLLAGHTQTVFITAVGLCLWIGTDWVLDGRRKRQSNGYEQSILPGGIKALVYRLIPLALALLLSALLAAIQLLPTIELAQHSARQGGLPVNEVLSFSLHPLLLSRSLLPGYGQSLYSEYVAWLPISAILLAFTGIALRPRNGRVINSLILAIAGLFLALGLFNPIYQLLARLPIFDLFRVPARWLALYALGMAFLAGSGWQVVADRYRADGQETGHKGALRMLVMAFAAIGGLIAWSYLSVPLSNIIPLGEETTAQFPGSPTTVAWLVELFIVGLLLLTGYRTRIFRPDILFVIVAAVIIVVQWSASRALPLNQPTTPEAYFDLRPPIARLKAQTQCLKNTAPCPEPPERILSLSEIFFDVGDQPEIDTIYRDQLSIEARYDYTIAIKQKEVIAPNLPLAYGLSSVDGFDGGILPLRAYTLFTRLLLKDGEESKDGRLREYLEGVPEARWLDLLNVGYLVTDKVGDVWQNEVFFDLQHPVTLDSKDNRAAVGYIPEAEATEIWMIANGRLGQVVVKREDGRPILVHGQSMGDELLRFAFPEPLTPRSIELQYHDDGVGADGDDAWLVRGLSLVDNRDGSFWTLVPGNYRLIHSGDVKIYQNMDVLPRAFLVNNWIFETSLEEALYSLAKEEFDPAITAVVLGAGQDHATESNQGELSFIRYEPELVVLHSNSDRQALLILADAFYPGWKATIDEEPAPILQTDILFRGIIVPAGEHQISLSYEPVNYAIGRWASLMGILLFVGLIVYGHRLS